MMQDSPVEWAFATSADSSLLSKGFPLRALSEFSGMCIAASLPPVGIGGCSNVRSKGFGSVDNSGVSLSWEGLRRHPCGGCHRASGLSASTISSASSVVSPADIVDRTTKGDRLPLVPTLPTKSIEPALSMHRLPVGCEAAASPLSHPSSAHIARHCLS
jgi:hypothetical protein